MLRSGRASAVARSALALSVAGLLVGTFLPWVDSGRARRNVYQLAGLADRLGAMGFLPLGLAFVVPLLVALPAVFLMVGQGRAAGVCAAVVALAMGAGAVAALAAGPTGIIAIDTLGPAVTAIAASSLLIAAVGTVLCPGTGPARGERAEGRTPLNYRR